MRCLAVDATQDFYSIAIFLDGDCFYRAFPNKAQLSKNLVVDIGNMIDEAGMRLSDLDVFIVNPGPGSFTGIRASIAALQAFEIVFKKPLYGISMFEAVALCNKNLLPIDKVAVIAIKCDEFNSFMQCYDHNMQAVSAVIKVHNDKIPDSGVDMIITNNKNCGDLHVLVEANAETLCKAFSLQDFQSLIFKSAVPIYI